MHPEETKSAHIQCAYCSKKCEGKSGLKQHERACAAIPKDKFADTHKHACPQFSDE